MHIFVIVNDFSGTTGIVGDRIIERGGYYEVCHPHVATAYPTQTNTLPGTGAGYDGLIVMGGAMDAFDDAGYPQFQNVLQLIRDFHEAGKPVLGICLGVQLITRAFAGAVYRHSGLEIGFTELTVTAAGCEDPLLRDLAARQWIFQWHQDTFDLPGQALLLMSGDNCRHQAIRIGDGTYGFQCHFEVTLDMVREWLRNGAAKLTAEHPQVLADSERQLQTHLAAAQRFGNTVTRRWLDLVEARKNQR
jgi:GMP synthase-like glutamine amidotransferase